MMCQGWFISCSIDTTLWDGCWWGAGGGGGCVYMGAEDIWELNVLVTFCYDSN